MFALVDRLAGLAQQKFSVSELVQHGWFCLIFIRILPSPCQSKHFAKASCDFKKRGEHLTYIAISIFVVWHTLAMVIAPAPNSDVTLSLRVVLQPYLTFLRLDNQWDFFAPTVGEGSRLRYDIQDRTGKTHTFLPAKELSWFHPNFFWFRSWYYEIIDDPDNYGDYAAAQFCRKHASLQPVAITFYEIQEKKFTREDYLSGKNRMDPGFFTVKKLRSIRCPKN